MTMKSSTSDIHPKHESFFTTSSEWKCHGNGGFSGTQLGFCKLGQYVRPIGKHCRYSVVPNGLIIKETIMEDSRKIAPITLIFYLIDKTHVSIYK